jgi:hypothetical protein
MREDIGAQIPQVRNIIRQIGFEFGIADKHDNRMDESRA